MPVTFVKVHNTPDGNFPNGIPNPLLPECRDDTRNAVIEHGADMGIAFDSNFIAAYLFDEKGQFVGYYIVGLLAEAFLSRKTRGEDHSRSRVFPGTPVDVVKATGGEPVMSKTGHTSYNEERMREEAPSTAAR
ncbi:hypothetical protein ACNKHS_12465 [Shigella flexneri]